MDTPSRIQNEKPGATVEDSPVFNYISNLSPIEPVRSLHITQSFQSLNFSTIPSVFASPHVSTQKEPRKLRRYQLVPEASPSNANEGKASSGVPLPVSLSTSAAEYCNAGSSLEEFSVVSHAQRKKLAIKLRQTLKYDRSGPSNSDCHDSKKDGEAAMSAPHAAQVHCNQEDPGKLFSQLETEAESSAVCQIEQTKEEEPRCDWLALISESATGDLLNFDESVESDVCRRQDNQLSDGTTDSYASLFPGTPRDDCDNFQEGQPGDDCGEQFQNLVDSDANSFAATVLRSPDDNVEGIEENNAHACFNLASHDMGSHLAEVVDVNETDHTPGMLLSSYQIEQETRENYGKHDGKGQDSDLLGCEQQRGTRRRCLVFEMAGVHRKKVGNDSKSSHLKLHCDVNSVADEKRSLSHMRGTVSPPCILPGIGLHLNSLASTSKENGAVKHETLASGKRLISLPKSAGSFHSVTVGQKSLDKSLAVISIEGQPIQALPIQSMKEASDMHHATIQVPEFGGDEEFTPDSPKKKRCRLEIAGETESCKRCNCKKSKCLKLYCECFAAGVYCIEPCLCQDCHNKPVHEQTVLATRKQIESRNPLAFAPKVIRSSDSAVDAREESNMTPSSARHKKGCNCKKSNCLKKYCECFQGGVGCSSNCRCEGCKNKFGTKDGSAFRGADEAELEGDESEAAEKAEPRERMRMIDSHAAKLTHPGSLPNKCSFQNRSYEPPTSLPFESSMYVEYSCQTHPREDSLASQLKCENCCDMAAEDDDTPEILRGHGSPISGVKTTSPNKKRVAPPHHKLVLCSARRGMKDSVLQSIPPFPSLTPQLKEQDLMKIE